MNLYDNKNSEWPPDYLVRRPDSSRSNSMLRRNIRRLSDGRYAVTPYTGCRIIADDSPEFQTAVNKEMFREIEELKQAYVKSREYIDQLETEKYEKDSEIEGLRDESKLATEAFKQNTDLKQRMTDLANAVDAYLAVDGFHHPIEGMELQRARLNLRSVSQHAREEMER